MHHVYTFTATPVWVNSVRRWDDGDDYFPVISEIAALGYWIDYCLHNRKVPYVEKSFAHSIRGNSSETMTMCTIHAPIGFRGTVSFGGVRFPLNSSIPPIPCVPYHDILITGTVEEEGDTVTIEYVLEKTPPSAAPVAYQGKVMTVQGGMYTWMDPPNSDSWKAELAELLQESRTKTA